MVIMLRWTARKPELSYLYSGDRRRENNPGRGVLVPGGQATHITKGVLAVRQPLLGGLRVWAHT